MLGLGIIKSAYSYFIEKNTINEVFTKCCSNQTSDETKIESIENTMTVAVNKLKYICSNKNNTINKEMDSMAKGIYEFIRTILNSKQIVGYYDGKMVKFSNVDIDTFNYSIKTFFLQDLWNCFYYTSYNKTLYIYSDNFIQIIFTICQIDKPQVCTHIVEVFAK